MSIQASRAPGEAGQTELVLVGVDERAAVLVGQAPEQKFPGLGKSCASSTSTASKLCSGVRPAASSAIRAGSRFSQQVAPPWYVCSDTPTYRCDVMTVGEHPVGLPSLRTTCCGV